MITVIQGIFTDYKQPFAITYLGASLMVVYLPVAFVKDWICNLLRKNSSKSARSPQIVNNPGSGINSPVKHHDAQKLVEMESQVLLTKKDSDLDLSAQEEEQSLISKIRDEIDTEVLKEKRSFTAKEIATYAFYLAPIWFVTENNIHISFIAWMQYFSNAALARTSVASTTVLSSTSGLFTLFVGVLLRQDTLNMAKVVAVFVSMAGVVMTTLGKTWATDDSQISSTRYNLLRMCFKYYNMNIAVLLKKFAGEEGEGVDVQKLFGYVGLFTLVSLWWLGKDMIKLFYNFNFILLAIRMTS
ncbi:hypothetical protein BHE74_00036211 [Ensete ventricosum]|nr:hypothetical protein GW17_00037470 [Ensete ventricosum]RWW57030.1 hypothetical protein BHE74_00036211 [Ensete ventricosum]RZS18030.1 hypothetical protein BHM03_00050252 [Ensete ventricosum]